MAQGQTFLKWGGGGGGGGDSIKRGEGKGVGEGGGGGRGGGGGTLQNCVMHLKKNYFFLPP